MIFQSVHRRFVYQCFHVPSQEVKWVYFLWAGRPSRKYTSCNPLWGIYGIQELANHGVNVIGALSCMSYMFIRVVSEVGCNKQGRTRSQCIFNTPKEHAPSETGFPTSPCFFNYTVIHLIIWIRLSFINGGYGISL